MQYERDTWSLESKIFDGISLHNACGSFCASLYNLLAIMDGHMRLM